MTPRLAASAVVLLLAVGTLAGCAAPSTPPATSAPATEPASLPAGPTEGGPLIAPITVEVGDLQGQTVQLQIGQVLNINTGDLAVDSYSGTVADSEVAEFTAGREEGGATFNPGVTGLAEGTTEVTLANSDGGIQNVVFTVVVSAAG